MFKISQLSNGGFNVEIHRIGDFHQTFHFGCMADWLRAIRKYNMAAEMLSDFDVDELEYFGFVAEHLRLALNSL